MEEIKIDEYIKKLEEVIDQQFSMISKKAPINHAMSEPLKDLIGAYREINLLKHEMIKHPKIAQQYFGHHPLNS